MAGMAIRPTIQALVEKLEQLRLEQIELIEERGKLLFRMEELASRQAEFKALLEAERAKFKKRGWSN